MRHLSSIIRHLCFFKNIIEGCWLTLSPGPPRSPWCWCPQWGPGSGPRTCGRTACGNTWSGRRARSRLSTRRAAPGRAGPRPAPSQHSWSPSCSQHHVITTQCFSSLVFLFVDTISPTSQLCSPNTSFLLKTLEAVFVDCGPIRNYVCFHWPIGG